MKTGLLLLVPSLFVGGCIDVVSRVSTGDGDGEGAGVRVIGNGKPVAERRHAEAATAIEASGALTVEVRTGAPSLTVEAQKEVLPHLRTEFKNGRLRVWTEGRVSTDGTMRVRYTTPSLSEIVANGATTVDAQALAGDLVKVEATGASKVQADGRAGRLEVEATGASEARLKGVEAQDVEVEATGAARAWVTARKKVKASATGASEVRYYGTPANVSCDASGASSAGPG